MKILLIIDLQSEFINENTQDLVRKINDLRHSGEYDKIIFTRFINSTNSPVYKMGWHGCMDEASCRICLEMGKSIVLDKNTYTAYNDELIACLGGCDVSEIYMCGLDIDCCVMMTAINLFENGYNVFVLKDFVGCMQGEKFKNAALDILKRNIGRVRVI